MVGSKSSLVHFLNVFLAGPSGLAVISLLKVDSLLLLITAREAKKVSVS
jgi:hypothetical protein